MRVVEFALWCGSRANGDAKENVVGGPVTRWPDMRESELEVFEGLFEKLLGRRQDPNLVSRKSCDQGYIARLLSAATHMALTLTE